MLHKLLIIFSLVLFTASCKTISTEDQVEEEEVFETFEPEEQSQEEQEFEVIEDEMAAEDSNEDVEEVIEEVEVSDRIFFSLDQSSLTDESKKVLDTQSAWLKSEPSIKVIIEGHCDERGAREYNIILGERRALATKNYLVGSGIAASRVKIVSYGKERPAFIGAGEEIWSKNRRTVTVIEE